MNKNDLYKLVKVLQYRSTKDPVKRELYLINKERQRIHKAGKLVYCKEIDLTLDPVRFSFIFPMYDRMVELRNSAGATFRLENEVIVSQISGLNLEITVTEDIYILWEIFCTGTYNFESRPDKSWVVVDIGMNVGFASLFYCLNKAVTKVYGFEPFLPTYRQALRNIGLNRTLSDKIVPHQFGLGSDDDSMVVDYSANQRGRVGIFGTSLIRGEVHSRTQEKIEIRKASAVLKDIIGWSGDAEYLAKIDTEGSEYGILQDLFEESLLGKFSIVIIEWHEQGPGALLKWLTQSGFDCFDINNTSTTGMIYAIRR
jgi:FkbM family methyltransferase